MEGGLKVERSVLEYRARILKGLINRITVLAVLIIILSISGVLAWYQLSRRYDDSNIGKNAFTYEQQIMTLRSIYRNIANLEDFVFEQKRILIESQKLINDLQTEHGELRPIVEADRKLVQAILQSESERRKKDIWINRGFSFAAGIFASLVAAIILYSIKFIRTKRQDKLPKALQQKGKAKK